MLTLLTLVDVADLPPAAPLWERMLLESPILTGTLVLILGILARVGARSADRPRLGDGLLLAGVLLGGGVATLATLVETDRERIAAASEAFVRAAATSDVRAAERLLAPNIAIGSGGAAVDRDRGWLLAGIREMDGVIDSHNYYPMGVRSERPAFATSRFRVGATFTAAAGGGSVPSHWELDWRKGPDGDWTIVKIECLAVWRQRPSATWVNWMDRLAR